MTDPLLLGSLLGNILFKIPGPYRLEDGFLSYLICRKLSYICERNLPSYFGNIRIVKSYLFLGKGYFVCDYSCNGSFANSTWSGNPENSTITSSRQNMLDSVYSLILP